MKAPAHGAAHTLSLQSKSPHLYALYFPRNLREALQSAHRTPSTMGSESTTKGFQHHKSIRSQGSKLGGERIQRKLLKPKKDQSLDKGTSKCEYTLIPYL